VRDFMKHAPKKPTSPMLLSWLEKAVNQSGLTREAIAQRLKDIGRIQTVDKSLIGKILNGERGISADEMFAIAEITKVPFPGQLKVESGSTVVHMHMAQRIKALNDELGLDALTALKADG
jgi:transcriptional regulator with XRE-family HTH domain